MRRRPTTDALSPTPTTRIRLHFEGRSVQLVAAWTLAMGGMAATQALTTPARTTGSSASVSLAAPASALPPLSARLPRK